MAGIVECVPNFSEGRDALVIDSIVNAMTAVPGVRLLDRSMDAGHNRAVVSIIGAPESVEEAAFQGVAEAARLIDLRSHQGEHPRMGAADVVPFIPIRDVTMDECVALARRVGERIGRELRIPVFLYEEAAARVDRRNLAEVRAPQFEGLRDLLGRDPSREPDYGPNAIHPSAGAVAIGARHLLVAYNVYLNTADQDVAKAVARAVRSQTGGLRYVRALGIAADETGRVHVSMNLINTDGTPIHRVVEMIRSEAARYGASIVESEVVGLVSAGTLLDAAEHYLQLNGFSRSQVLEFRLLEEMDRMEKPSSEPLETPEESPVPGESPSPVATGMLDLPVREFSLRVASGDAVPGGGSVSALVAALASALVVMVTRLTIGRKRFADIEGRMKQLEARSDELRTRLLDLVEADSHAYLDFMAAHRRVKDGEEDARPALAAAALRAAHIPLQTARAAMEAMDLAREACETGNPVARTDACVAAVAAHAAVLGACLNVRVNVPSLTPEQNPAGLEAEAGFLEVRASALLSEVLGIARN